MLGATEEQHGSHVAACVKPLKGIPPGNLECAPGGFVVSGSVVPFAAPFARSAAPSAALCILFEVSAVTCTVTSVFGNMLDDV